MRVWLIEERKKRRQTQLDLAHEVGISRAYLAQIELGLRTPSVRVAKKLAEALSVPWTRFYEDADILEE
ncbi:MAG: helix-turn-helix transcriptional regulator [Clostridia bacterium]|nr:helix-turn-helix transcriptional regulator [Clostridia bacterium]